MFMDGIEGRHRTRDVDCTKSITFGSKLSFHCAQITIFFTFGKCSVRNLSTALHKNSHRSLYPQILLTKKVTFGAVFPYIHRQTLQKKSPCLQKKSPFARNTLGMYGCFCSKRFLKGLLKGLLKLCSKRKNT